TLVATQTPRSFKSWTEFPALLSTLITKSLSPQVIVTAGEWKRTIQVKGATAEDLFHDPAQTVFTLEPRLGEILQRLPKPAFFYRMSTVKLKRKSGTVLEINATP